MKKKLFSYILISICIICCLVNIIYPVFWRKDYNFDNILGYGLLLISLVFLTIFIKNNKEKVMSINISLIVLILYNVILLNNLFGFINISYFKSMPNFTNRSYTEVIKWAKKNNVIINENYEYSDLTKEYFVISQNVNSGTNLSKVKEMSIVISSGKNPEKDLMIPDMTGYNIDKVLDYIEENGLLNVKIEYEDNEDEKEDNLIKQSIIGNIKRNDEITFTFSRGDLKLEDEVTLINLTGMSKLRATAYLAKYAIDYIIEEDFSDSIKKNYVMKQSIPYKDKINRLLEQLALTISKGKKIVVPDFSKMDLDEISSWAVKNKLKLEISKKYDDTIKKDKIISSSVKKGDNVVEGDKIILTVSKGQITMLDFSNVDEFKNWAIKYGINYSIEYDFSEDIENGKIISFSHKKGETVKNNDTIVVTVSNGNSVKVPSFIGMTKKNIQAKCKEVNLTCSFQYQSSNKDKDIAIRQSLSAGSNVASKTSISIILSSGKVEKQSNTSSSKSTTNNSSNNNSSNNSNNSSSSNNNTEPKEESCTVKTVAIDYDFMKIFEKNISNQNYDTVYKELTSYFNSRGVSIKINSDSTSQKPPGYLISGPVVGDSVTTCCPNNCQTYSITISR